ncbi:MAG: 23S rRNA (uracil(1939)-C(5))-methyltransferase RlmD [Eubacteriales bacterium]|nr:23S rRNA (uracil(1939)-C(5))-methyltransferase RlmD [Eubacteriales bacterium]
MKKGEMAAGLVESVTFPNHGVMTVAGVPVHVKGVIPGQHIRARITKRRSTSCKAAFPEVTERSPLETEPVQCAVFGACGGCFYQRVPYAEQLNIKAAMVEKLLRPYLNPGIFEGITGSPVETGYRNKMEYSFGDAVKGGPMTLGLHKKQSKYDVLDLDDCILTDDDFDRVRCFTRDYFTAAGLSFYHKITHTGYLRYLVVRKGIRTGRLLIMLVTSSQAKPDLQPWVDGLLALDLAAEIDGVIHTVTDSFADAVKDEGSRVLYGRDYYEERLFDLTFRVTGFSFFQTNTLGAEVLYGKVIEYLGDCENKRVFDLYSGTGTIAQIVAASAAEVTGVEIVEEAVEAAKRNAAENGLTNCTFLAGDVLQVVDGLTEKPDLIILDPPREGIHPKALPKIIDFGVDRIVYVSCKPTSLAKDLAAFTEAGYEVTRACCVDMFPYTVHVETVCLMTRTK